MDDSDFEDLRTGSDRQDHSLSVETARMRGQIDIVQASNDIHTGYTGSNEQEISKIRSIF